MDDFQWPEIFFYEGLVIILFMHRSSVEKSQRKILSYQKEAHVHKRKPNGFRVVMKNRSNGLNEINDNLSTSDYQSVSQSLQKQFQTQSSFRTVSNSNANPSIMSRGDMNQTKQKLKQFAKSMKADKGAKQMVDINREKEKRMSTYQDINTNFYKKQRHSIHSGEGSRSRRDSLQEFQVSLPNKFLAQGLKLEDLERKLDALIQLKLIKTQNDIKNGQKTVANIDILDELDIQIKQLIQAIVKLEESGDDEVALESVNRKILLLEKAMAESATESQMIRKFYFSKTTNRKINPHKLYSSHQTMGMANSNEFNKLRSTSRSGMRINNSVSKQSISKSNYKAPKREDYERKTAKPKFQFNNQPLPRSSYDRDFLTYGYLPKFSYKQESTNIMSSASKTLEKSIYKNDFTTKKSQKIDFKELDCFKDKFKNLKISFMDAGRHVKTEQSECDEDHKKQTSKLEKYSVFKNKKVAKQISNDETHFIKDMKTENGVSFAGEKPTIKSLIKHKNLNSLKYSYKASMNT